MTFIHVVTGKSSGSRGKDGEGVWIRRDQPSEAAEAGQREWLRVSGSDEVMQAFKAELLAMQPDAQVFTPVIVAPGTTRIHQVNCALVRAGQRFTHLQCPSCAGDLQSEFDRLVPDESKVLHSQLTCPALKEVAQGRLLILPGISSGICSGISFWHSIWHSIWHIIWQTFWHFIWHIFWHSI